MSTDTSIGECIVANPPILFLDEPTSGLDSAAAYQLVLNLKEIAKKTGVTVIASIHQPSERVFELSDRLLLLAGGKQGGNTAYFGPTENVEEHFSSQGLVKTASTSVAEWLLDEVNGDFGDEVSIQAIVDFWPISPANNLLHAEISKASQILTTAPIVVPATSPLKALRATGVLMVRGCRNIIRNPAVLWLRFAMYIALSFMICTGIYTNIYIYIHKRVHTRVRTRTYTRTHILSLCLCLFVSQARIHTRTFMYLCIYVYINVCLYIDIYLLYIYICICIYVYTYIYILIYTCKFQCTCTSSYVITYTYTQRCIIHIFTKFWHSVVGNWKGHQGRRHPKHCWRALFHRCFHGQHVHLRAACLS